MRRYAIPAMLACCVVWAGTARLRAQTAAQELDARSSQMIGQTAPAWITKGWVNADSLDIQQLRGKVVLLRFLTDNPVGAPALNELSRTYESKGFAVVGMYTPQPMPAETDLKDVRVMASSQGFEFPVGLDSRWETLNRYWLQQANADLTATAFLIDRKGVIRYIHPDGMYEKNSRNRALRKEYDLLVKEIETLLKPEAGFGKTVEEPKGKRSSEKFLSGRGL